MIFLRVEGGEIMRVRNRNKVKKERKQNLYHNFKKRGRKQHRARKYSKRFKKIKNNSEKHRKQIGENDPPQQYQQQ